MRRGMKYCILCNPDGNGTAGETGTEAVGKYYLPKAPGQCRSGWLPVCESCAETVSKIFSVTYFNPVKSYISDSSNILHDWEKQNLVTLRDESGMYDLLKCRNCRTEVKRRGLSGYVPREGCRGEIHAGL